MKNDSKGNSQSEIINTKKITKKMRLMQIAKQKRIEAEARRKHEEANARRMVAKSWALLAKGVKYQKAAVKESCYRLTSILKEELFDGIFLNLNVRNSVKSYSCQKRILRRIVDKRQAQFVHRLACKSDRRFKEHLQRYYAGQSMDCLQRYHQCAIL